MISTNQFKNGSHIEVDGQIFRIVEFQHVKPGKGGAFVRTKLRRVADGSVMDKTFRAGEKFRPVRTESRKMQYLYDSGEAVVFMDSRDYEQIEIPRDSVGDAMKWVLPNSEVEILFVDERPSDVQVPSALDMTVTSTEPGVKGDTASGGGQKPATLESGVVVQVPLFIEEGERIRVDTRSGEYVSPRLMRRSDQRRDAVFALYRRDVTGKEPAADEPARPFTRELIDGVDAHRSELDSQISKHARGWTLDRIPPLDRNIMRVALYETAPPRRRPDRGCPRRGNRARQAVLRGRRTGLHQRRPGCGGARDGAEPVSRLAEISERLEAITRQLGEKGEGDSAPTDEQIAALTAEAADLAAEAVEEVNRRLRQSPGDG